MEKLEAGGLFSLDGENGKKPNAGTLQTEFRNSVGVQSAFLTQNRVHVTGNGWKCCVLEVLPLILLNVLSGDCILSHGLPLPGVTAMLKFQVVEEHGQYMRCVTQPIAVGLAACVCVCTAWVPRQQPSLEQGALSSTAWAAQVGFEGQVTSSLHSVLVL